MHTPSVITIDGPAGAGKSTLGALLAQQLGYLYFDTGVMYRALTLIALRRRLDLDDALALEQLARQIKIEVLEPSTPDGRQYTVCVDGEDVTWAIRAPEVNRAVSQVSRHPGVRTEMVRQQQDIGRRGNVVMVGRDIGTIVMPHAELKIYLEASLDERARRRAAEERKRGQETALEQIRADIARRDELDHHVMRPASDALILNSDDLSPDREVAWILERMPVVKQSPTKVSSHNTRV
ncbi:MAG: (d)CMP kinase [Chloroflexales bacterium]|nr:(d)CMP kinase [Chloroflexales bacterium]